MEFDASNVVPEEARDFTPLPEGAYHIVITQAEPVYSTNPTSKAGEMLLLVSTIDSDDHPEYAGRKIFSRLCINHESQQARAIAQRKLSSLLHAVDLIHMHSHTELLGAHAIARLKVSPARGDYGPSNDVVSWSVPADEEPTQQPAEKPHKSEPINPPGLKHRGWRR